MLGCAINLGTAQPGASLHRWTSGAPAPARRVGAKRSRNSNRTRRQRGASWTKDAYRSIAALANRARHTTRRPRQTRGPLQIGRGRAARNVGSGPRASLRKRAAAAAAAAGRDRPKPERETSPPKTPPNAEQPQARSTRSRAPSSLKDTSSTPAGPRRSHRTGLPPDSRRRRAEKQHGGGGSHSRHYGGCGGRGRPTRRNQPISAPGPAGAARAAIDRRRSSAGLAGRPSPARSGGVEVTPSALCVGRPSPRGSPRRRTRQRNLSSLAALL